MKKNIGFTLIELLIVIALLGALAVGLLATVDPFEQLKKGTDTSIRNTTAEVYNSAIRYYAIKNAFPWTDAPITGLRLDNARMTDAVTGYLQLIISAGELKPEFIQLADGNLNSIYLTSTEDFAGVTQNVAACFQPQSKSFKNDKNSKYNNDGAEGTNCVATAAGGSGCFWCIK